MNHDESEVVQRLLAGADADRPESLAELADAMYKPLRSLAERYLRRQFGKAAEGLTWQPTSLVNETLLRVIRQRAKYDCRGHFLAIATTVMKRVLLDYARERGAQKRGGGRVRVSFDAEKHSPIEADRSVADDIEAVFAVVDRLASIDPRKGDVARMRIVWGMTTDEIADSLGVGTATVERDWAFARAWLRRELDALGP